MDPRECVWIIRN